jgi:murein DD-endopeptidase MepM/ murein hydrolase activator NlpD
MMYPNMRTIVLHVFILYLLAACSSAITPTRTATEMVTPTLLTAPTPTSQPSPTPTLVITVCSPLINHSLDELPSLITWAFKMPNPGRDDGHHGVDLGHWSLGTEISTLNDPIQPVLSGRVAAAIHDRPPYGNMIIIEVPYTNLPLTLIELVPIPSGQSLYILYAHLADAPDLSIGQSVSCGQEIDRVGLTGWTGAPHLHFETRWGPPGMTFTEMAYYTGDATTTEMENYLSWRMSGTFHVFDPMILLTLQP